MKFLRVHVQKSVGKPDAGDLHVRFDERGTETGRAVSSVPAPFLDSTGGIAVCDPNGLGAQISLFCAGMRTQRQLVESRRVAKPNGLVIFDFRWTSRS
jgi:hypothetical protein